MSFKDSFTFLPNKDNILVISVHKDSLIETLTPNIFSSRSGPTTSIVVISNALAIIGFIAYQSTPLKEE
jgi:hypothetical protein